MRQEQGIDFCPAPTLHTSTGALFERYVAAVEVHEGIQKPAPIGLTCDGYYTRAEGPCGDRLCRECTAYDLSPGPTCRGGTHLEKSAWRRLPRSPK